MRQEEVILGLVHQLATLLIRLDHRLGANGIDEELCRQQGKANVLHHDRHVLAAIFHVMAEPRDGRLKKTGEETLKLARPYFEGKNKFCHAFEKYDTRTNLFKYVIYQQ